MSLILLLACSEPLVPPPPKPGEPILAEKPAGGDPVVKPPKPEAPAGGGNPVGTPPTVEVGTRAVPGAPSVSGDQAAIAEIVEKSNGRVQTCVNRALATNRGVNGRISAGWTIVDGRVTVARVVTNTTGDDALAECVVRAVKTFRFPPGLNAEVAEYPWVVEGM